MPQLLGYASGVLSALAFFPYIRGILFGETRPQRASWLIWSVLTTIAFFSQLAKGATDSLWVTGTGAVGVTLIFLVSLKFGVGGLTRRDVAALGTAAGIIFLWYLTQEAAVALFLTIAANGIGLSLTLVKAYQNPESETMVAWMVVGIAGILAMFAVGKFDLVLLAYPAYIALANFSVAAAIILGRRRKD